MKQQFKKKLIALAVAAVCLAGANTVQAQAFPTGSVSGPVDYTTPGQWVTRSYTWTATTSGANYVGFAFRQVPAFWTFTNVTVGGTTIYNGNMASGGQVPGNYIYAPTGWGVWYQTGTTPSAAGSWQNGGNPSGTGGVWYDGAVQSYDGIYQSFTAVAGQTYTISFQLEGDDPTSVGSGIAVGVYAGACGAGTTVFNCTPGGGFTALATPDQTAGAVTPGVTPPPPPTPPGPTLVTTISSGTVVPASTIDTTQTTTVNSGTIQADQATQTLSQNINISGISVVDQNGNQITLSGVIGGTGSLTISNTASGGSVTLTATNTYTGATTIDSGATLNNQGSIASSSGVTNNGTFNNSGTASVVVNNGSFDNTSTGTVSTLNNTSTATNEGVITGAVTNSGTFTNLGTTGDVTNTNIFSNLLNGVINSLTNSGTATNAGTITTTVINNGGTFTNSGTTGDITNNTGTVTNNGSTGNVSNAGTFTNSGILGTVNNSGTFNMTTGTAGNITNSSSFDLSGGTVGTITNTGTVGMTAGTSGNVINSNTFNLAGGATGAVSNAGTFNQTGGSSTLINNAGTGTVNLSGGTTNITNSGTANQTGGTASTVTNNGTYTVSGGNVGSITNNNILNVNGVLTTTNYTQTSSGSTVLHWTPIGVQQITATGTASLAGNLQLNQPAGSEFRPNYGQYGILTAGAVTGKYDTLTLNPDLAPLGYGLVYTGTGVSLKVTPSAAYTSAAVNSTSSNLANVSNLQAGSLGGTLNYDCNLFGDSGMCVSTGVRTTSDSAGSIKGGNFIISYRTSPNWRVGVFVDQSIGNTTVGNIKLNTNPALGGFVNWNEDARGYGWGVQGSAAMSAGNVDINRAGTAYSESATGKTTTSGQAFQLKTTYAMPITTRDTVTPYAGIRYTTITNDGFTESGAVYPITYGSVTQSTTDALAGISLSHNFGRFTGSVSTGVIQNLSYSAGTLTGSSGIIGLNSINTKLPGSGYTSLSLGTGISYDLAKNQYVGLSVGWQQKSLLNTSILSGALTYTVGF